MSDLGLWREEEVGGYGGVLSAGSLLESTQAAFKRYLYPGALAVVHHQCVQIGFVRCWSPTLHPQSSQSPVILVSPA